MKKSAQILVDSVLNNPRVLTEGHFVLSGGAHSRHYFNKREVLKDPVLIMGLADEIADRFLGIGIDTVIAPAIGAITLSNNVAQVLSQKQQKTVMGIWAEKDGKGGFKIPQTWGEALKGKKVLVVEDVISTGTGARKVIALTRNNGGKVVGLGVILNRGKLTEKDFGGLHLESVIDFPIEVFSEDTCPLCRGAVPVNEDVGHGREFNQNKR